MAIRQWSRCKGVLAAAVVLVAVVASGRADAQGRTGSHTEAQQLLDEADALVKAGKAEEAHAKYKAAIKSDPQLAPVYERYAMSLFARKKYREGARVAHAGLKQVPGNAVIKAALGMNLFKLGQGKQALGYLKDAVSAMPTKFAVQVSAAKCCLKFQEWSCAISALKNFLSHRPSRIAKQDYVFRTFLGVAQLRGGDVKTAGKTLQLVLRSKPRHVPARLAMAEVFLKRGDCSRSVAAYEQLLAKVKSQEIHLNLGQAYLCSRRFSAALKQAKTYLTRNRSSSAGLLLKGDAAAQLKKNDLALAAYNSVAAKDGWSSELRLRMAQVYYNKKNYTRALQQISRELKQAKVPPGVLMLALRAAIRTKKRDQALKYGRRLVAMAPKDADARYYAGMAMSSSGKFDEAIDSFEKTLKLKGSHRGAARELVKALCFQARHALRAGKLAEVVEKMRRAYSIDERSLVVNRNLALAFLKQGKNKRALAHLKVVLKKTPRDFVANRLAGRAYVAMGKLKRSQAHFQAAVGAVIRLPSVALARALAESAVIRLRLGQINQGVVELERALDLARTKGKAPKLVQDLQRNIARAYVIKSRTSLKDNKPKQAWTELQRAMGASAGLPAAERMVVQAASAFAAMSVGQVAKGKELAKKLRGKMGKVLMAPYNKIGEKLLFAYADYLSPAPKKKLAAARRFIKMAGKLKEPARKKLLALARSAHEQAAVQLFKAGRRALAQRALARAVKLTAGASPEQRHNMAVVNYLAGKKGPALATLEGLKGKVPLAHCNLAVHYETSGAGERAFELFQACQRARAPYPKLNAIVEAKRRVFGGK